MTKNILKNEQIKRDFFEQLKGGHGFAEGSVKTFADTIKLWQRFSDDDDFLNFNKSQATAFQEWLSSKESRTESKRLSLSTQYGHLRRLKKFFRWLADQQGYKKIPKSDINFLRLSKRESQIARMGTKKGMPTFEEAKKIIESIKIESDIDKRDRAIICLALITGMRISALISLKIKSLDRQNMIIDQNPADGVKTKNSKRITTAFFPIGWEEPQRYFLEWFDYLKAENFKSDDPVFPATLRQLGTDKAKYSTYSVGRDFWSSAGSARKIFEKRCNNANVPYFHPHLFRHLIVSILEKERLTEEQKKAVSLNLGHEDVGTTFGAYGYGGMSNEDATKIVQKIRLSEGQGGRLTLSEGEMKALEDILERHRSSLLNPPKEYN